MNSHPTETLEPGQTRHELRIEEVLDCATRRFNRQSFTAVTMETVASDLNLMPATLYHYVEDKEELVFRCYNRVIDSYQRELEAANEQGLDGLEKVRTFVRSRLASTSGDRIAFTDLASLSSTRYRAISKGRRRNLQTLEALIDQGIADGSITPSTTRWTAIGVLSVVDWLAYWLSDRDVHSRLNALIAIDDVLTHGLYRRDRSPFDLPKGPSIPEPSIEGKRAQKKQALLRTAAILFNRKGVAATSMDEVAHKAGVTRAALYYHAKDKADLFNLSLMRGIEFVADAWRHIETEDPVSWAIQLQRYLFECHVSTLGPLPTYNNLNFLHPHHKAEVLKHLKDLDEGYRKVIRLGIDGGYFRDVPIFYAEKVHAALTNRFAIWYNDRTKTPARVVADNHTLLFLNGLKRRD